MKLNSNHDLPYFKTVTICSCAISTVSIHKERRYHKEGSLKDGFKTLELLAVFRNTLSLINNTFKITCCKMQIWNILKIFFYYVFLLYDYLEFYYSVLGSVFQPLKENWFVTYFTNPSVIGLTCTILQLLVNLKGNTYYNNYGLKTLFIDFLKICRWHNMHK